MKARQSILERANAREGFSLIEITTALFVLIVGLFGVFQLFHFGIGKMRVIDESSIAQQAVQNELEVLRALPFTQLQDGERDFVTQDPALQSLVQATGAINVTSAENSGLKRVDIALRWVTQNGRVAERSVTTLIGDKGP
ncbi:MAG: hypothetical protein IT366_00235 [Candidatus Hydrogenedentes bacterium]|nr:hypothetical protein [Candidatus Hydrogenedentota bacterium]